MLKKERPTWLQGTGPILKPRHGKVLKVVGSVGLLAVHFLPQTFLKESLQEATSLKRDGKNVELGTQLSVLLQRALTDLRFSDSEKSLVEGYITSSYHLQCFGSVNSMFGASIGLPEYFKFSNEEEAELHYLELPHVKNQRQVEDFQGVKETLVLSEKAKLYAIAREALRSKDWNFILQGVYAPLCFVQSINLSLWLEKKYLMEKGRFLRVPIFFCAALLGTAICIFLSDYTSYTFDEIAETEMCKLGQSYMEGGIEFYEKMMLRQRHLRSLLGGMGKKLFLENGDHFNPRKTKLTLSERLAFIRKKIENRKKGVIYKLN